MSYAIDNTRSFTITLLQEGFANVVSFTVDKAIANPGESINFSFTLKNDGLGTDNLFARIVDVDTGAAILPDTEWPSVAVGGTINYSVSVIMPDKELKVRLESGHVE